MAFYSGSIERETRRYPWEMAVGRERETRMWFTCCMI